MDSNLTFLVGKVADSCDFLSLLLSRTESYVSNNTKLKPNNMPLDIEI